jgi:two-component system chemotaxis response regulator CheB
MIVIGSSTGGPAALEKIFSSIKAPINIPILITQHMPPVFTEMLARRLSDMTGIPCAEAKNGEVIKPNQMYIAPGDYHMIVVGNKAEYKIQLNQEAQRNSVRPAVDYLFETAADIFDRTCMGFVLTGMGEDGLIGAQALRRKGAAMMIQDKESCVVFGMPGAIYSSGDYDQIGNLETISTTIRRMTN